jgi:alkylated DNA repair dioxygenase AlkB
MRSAENQRVLFDSAGALPPGFVYDANFLTAEEEVALLEAIRQLPLAEALYKAFTAKRRILSFGAGYDFGASVLLPAPPVPPFLHPLRERVSEWTGVASDELIQCTVAEYARGTQLGWHRDLPHFGIVAGVSLRSPCRMRLRPYPHVKGRREGLALTLEPRSAYVMRGVARWGWQHAISPTKDLRYSITFRTMRRA